MSEQAIVTAARIFVETVETRSFELDAPDRGPDTGRGFPEDPRL